MPTTTYTNNEEVWYAEAAQVGMLLSLNLKWGRGKRKANDTTQKQIQAGNDTRVEAAGTHAHVCKCCNTGKLLDSKRTPCEKHSSTHRPRNECYLTK